MSVKLYVNPNGRVTTSKIVLIRHLGYYLGVGVFFTCCIIRSLSAAPQVENRNGLIHLAISASAEGPRS
jgi:hypothetical protein